MSLVRKTSDFPTLTAKGSDAYAAALQDNSFAKTPFYMLLAKMLMPFANIYSIQGGIYNRSLWMEYASARTYWHHSSANVGDVIVVSNTTKDTNQRLVYYFLVTDISNNGNRYGHCFLFLLEGEPPMWPDIST